jgi:tryptophanase
LEVGLLLTDGEGVMVRDYSTLIKHDEYHVCGEAMKKNRIDLRDCHDFGLTVPVAAGRVAEMLNFFTVANNMKADWVCVEKI